LIPALLSPSFPNPALMPTVSLFDVAVFCRLSINKFSVVMSTAPASTLAPLRVRFLLSLLRVPATICVLV
jgi:hypothetical protein